MSELASFLRHRELLFSVVYSMLGSVADTEDVLQETWLAWERREAAEPVADPRAYLVRVAVNRALRHRAAVSRRREEYAGPWLPEPIVTADDPAVRSESVSLALLVVLETLSPLERAVFVLNEVFGYAHPEIAAILGRTPVAVRQVAHRAREHVRARRPRYRPDPDVRREVTGRFLAAVTGGDLAELLRVLAPDVTLWADGGGKARAAGPRPVHGRDRVARLIAGDAARHPVPELAIENVSVNGEPAALLLSGGEPYLLLVLDLHPDRDQVSAVYAITNPDKLAGVR
jgi:RNA polymerase sigma factor (sigma-70 family)